MKRLYGSGRQGGFSVTEVLVVIVIISVIVVFAVAQFGGSRASFQTENVARELKVKLERARFDSVKRRPTAVTEMSRVVITSETSYSVTIDLNQNNRLETSETVITDFSGRTNARILRGGMSFPVTILFDRRGHITARDSSGADVTPVFTICNGCTGDDEDEADTFIVALSATGTVAMYRAGDAPGSVSDPTVTDVGTGSDIDPMVSIQENTAPPAGTPAPTPTVTPTPTPSATPSPSAMPTPSPISSATPTPTPHLCQRNERPAQTGCFCLAPMSVQSNGQCK